MTAKTATPRTDDAYEKWRHGPANADPFVIARKLETDRARLTEALEEIENVGMSHPYAGNTCMEIARRALKESK